MKSTISVAAGFAVAASASMLRSEPLAFVPVNACAGILGQAACDQKTPSSNGLVDVPVNACLGVLGEAHCSQSTSSGSGKSLISVPINLCLGILGQAECDQQSSSNGLVNVPIDACLAVLGEAECNKHGSPKNYVPNKQGSGSATAYPNGPGSGSAAPSDSAAASVPTGVDATAASAAPTGGAPSSVYKTITILPASSSPVSSPSSTPLSTVTPSPTPVSTTVKTVYNTVVTCPCSAAATPVTTSHPKPYATGRVPRPSSSAAGTYVPPTPSASPTPPAYTGAAGHVSLSFFTVAVCALLAVAI